MNKQRPVNLDLSTIRFPVTAIVSITHRITGVVLLGGVIVLMYILDLSLSSEAGFDQVKSAFDQLWVKLLVWAVLAALAYHSVAGVRHLIMDMGVGETLEGGKRGAAAVMVISAILVVVLGVWLW